MLADLSYFHTSLPSDTPDGSETLIALKAGVQAKLATSAVVGAIVPTNRRKILVVTTIGVSVNAVNTDVATLTGLPVKWQLFDIRLFDASIDLSLSLATVGAYSAAAAGGDNLVAPATITTLTAPTAVMPMTLAAVAATKYQTGNLYIRNVIAHGSAATVSVTVRIQDLT